MAEPEAIGLEQTVYAAFAQAISEEQDIVNKASGSVYTQEMQIADAERCNVYRRIMRKLTVCEFEAADSVQHMAWPVIERNLVVPYGLSVVQLPLQEKSAVITGFIMDARNQLTSEQLQKVGITSDLGQLESANTKFVSMFQERISEKSSQVAGYNSICRANTDAAWKHVYTLLNALANSTDESKKSQTACAVDVVNKINTLTEETRQRLTYRLKANKAFIDKRIINDAEELSLPLPMEEVSSITLEGNKLTVDNVKVVVLEKAQTGGSKHKTYTVAEFVDRFNGVVQTSKDTNIGVETMVISDFSMGAYAAVTIESVEINA